MAIKWITLIKWTTNELQHLKESTLSRQRTNKELPKELFVNTDQHLTLMKSDFYSCAALFIQDSAEAKRRDMDWEELIWVKLSDI